MISGRGLIPVDLPDEISGALRGPHVPRQPRGLQQQMFIRKFSACAHIPGDFHPESRSTPAACEGFEGFVLLTII
jgi:hypothetical protein